MKNIVLGTLLLAVTATTGCTYVTATPSVQGRTYVVRYGLMSSDYWSCDATGGEPACYQTKKKPLEAK